MTTTDTVTDPVPELVVLLDEEGHAVGTADKATVHHADTPLHLAFSVYLFDPEGRVLVSQRAPSKKTFPGVWTNSCCGHPAPGERLEDAVRRRVGQELGAEVTDLELVLPRFRYRAEQAGVVENEMCPVFVGRVEGTLSPDPTEVGDVRWEPWTDFRAAVLTGSEVVSAWCREQVQQLPEHPLDTAGAAVHDELPSAARVGLGS
ncbi:isopentenyl-diphosphate Delta-isomerase [Alloalcanivorax gelatiniphagus]